MSGGHTLYTPEILTAAMSLTEFPLDAGFSIRGTARSRSCGSAIEIGIALDPQGNVSALGIKPHACAVGQAAASIFAKGAVGQGRESLLNARTQVANWLANSGNAPDWPGIGLLRQARDYPARHSAILLAWDAALDALNQ